MFQKLSHHGIDLCDVTAGRRCWLEGERQRIGLVSGEHPLWGKRPPGITCLRCGDFQGLEGPVRAGRKVQAFRRDGAARAHGGGLPARSQEFRVGGLQIGDAGTDFLGIQQHNVRALGHQCRQWDEGGVDKRRYQCLHAVGGGAVGELSEQFHQRRIARVLHRQLLRASRDLIGNQQLTAGIHLNAGHLNIRDGALVGHGKLANIGDLIAPKLNTHRVIQRGRENINNAAAGGKLPALTHHIHVTIATKHQVARNILEGILPIHLKNKRLSARRARQNRLAKSPGRRHHNLEFRQLMQHLRAPTHNIHAGTQALMRQGLPRRKPRDALPQHGPQLRRHILRLTTRRRNQQHRRTLRDCRHRPRA